MSQILPGDFTAAGIGSLPYQETGPALDLIRECLPCIPHWPQLPRRGHQEHFLFQTLELLLQLGLVQERPAGRPVFTAGTDAWAAGLTAYYEIYLQAAAGEAAALARFGIPEPAAVGFYAFLDDLARQGTGAARFLKGQVAGPVSSGLYLEDSGGRAAFYDPQLRDLLVKTTAQQAVWQVQRLKPFDLPAIVFVDEPALAAYGTSSHVAIQRQDLVAAMAEVAEAIAAAGGIPGVHCCSGVEWPIFFEAGYRIVDFDAYSYFASLQVFAAEVAAFLSGGGVLAWGLVPTSDQAYDESPASLAERFAASVARLTRVGVPEPLLLRQALVTPACGTGVLELALAERIYRLTASLSRHLQGLYGS